MTMKTAELIQSLRRDAGDYRFVALGVEPVGQVLSWDQRNVRAWQAAEALEAATTPRTVTDAAEIDALPDRTVAIDKHGDVLHYRGGRWCSYETQPMGSEWVARKCAPLTIVHTPEAR
jgi:hypothetical protein